MLMPYQKANGTPNSSDQICEIERCIAQRFGGYTVCEKFGGWHSPNGDLVIDHHVALTCDVRDDLQVSEFIALAREWAEVLGQEALYISVSPVDIWLIAGTPMGTDIAVCEV
jgi:hypothetical protein